MQIFPSAKWWSTPLTTQPLWSPNVPYYPLTLRPNSGLDCLNNAPPWLNWFHLANIVSGSATCVSFLWGWANQLHTQGTWKFRVPLCLATHLKLWVAILPPWLLLAQLQNSLRNKGPLTRQKICLEQGGGTEGDQCSIYIYIYIFSA
jgi:hypothetical protein